MESISTATTTVDTSVAGRVTCGGRDKDTGVYRSHQPMPRLLGPLHACTHLRHVRQVEHRGRDAVVVGGSGHGLLWQCAGLQLPS